MMEPLRNTEMNTLATCEKRWHYRYVLNKHEEPSQAMSKGTLYHAVWDEWWAQEEGYSGITETNILARIPEDRQEGITEESWDDVNWMIQRYDQWRGGSFLATPWRVIKAEVEMDGMIGGHRFQGRCDDIRLHLPTERTYLGECKTMRDWRRLDILEVDTQVSNYVALAQDVFPDYDIVGVMYDAAKTYRWKRDEHKHPPTDSFQEILCLRDKPQLEAAALEVRFADERRADIIRTGQPIRNISANTCMSCSFRTDCWEELAFPEVEVDWSE